MLKPRGVHLLSGMLIHNSGTSGPRLGTGNHCDDLKRCIPSHRDSTGIRSRTHRTIPLTTKLMMKYISSLVPTWVAVGRNGFRVFGLRVPPIQSWLDLRKVQAFWIIEDLIQFEFKLGLVLLAGLKFLNLGRLSSTLEFVGSEDNLTTPHKSCVAYMPHLLLTAKQSSIFIIRVLLCPGCGINPTSSVAPWDRLIQSAYLSQNQKIPLEIHSPAISWSSPKHIAKWIGGCSPWLATPKERL
mgnify:FL=1